MLCVNHLFYQLGRFWLFGGEDTDMHGGRRVAGVFQVSLVFYWFIVVRDAHSPEVSMNIRTAKVCVPWFAILSIEGYPNFPQSIFLCCWNDLLPFYRHYSFCRVFWSTSNAIPNLCWEFCAINKGGFFAIAFVSTHYSKSYWREHTHSGRWRLWWFPWNWWEVYCK